MTEPSPKPRRRWFSISLRGLMILVLVVGGLMGWKARRASLQRRAVAQIKYLGGSVRYDWEPQPPFPGATAPPGTQGPSAPRWLRQMMGDEYFEEVVEVTLPDPLSHTFVEPPKLDSPPDSPVWQTTFREHVRRNQEVKEALERDQLACLEGLDRIEILSLWGPGLKSEGLAKLGQMSSLKHLTAMFSPINAEGLAEVAKLSRLENLDISLRLTDDAALALLEQIPGLKELSIYDGSVAKRGQNPESPEEPGKKPLPVTDAWLARLGRLGALTELSFDDGSRITDAGLAHLIGLSHLDFLKIDSSPFITDAGLAHLEGLKSLIFVDFSATDAITDAGLVHLKGLNKLKHLKLGSASKITDAGLATLASVETLEWIQLDAASLVTDGGVESLVKLARLRGLNLNAKSLTDAGLKRLGSLKNLKVLTLTGAKIKREILDEIQAALPGLSIRADRIGEESPADPVPNSTQSAIEKIPGGP